MLAQLALWWSLFENASASVRSGDIFSGFIYLISGSNSTVGYIQGINGCMQARNDSHIFSSLIMAVSPWLPCAQMHAQYG